MQRFLSGGGKEWLLIAVGALMVLAALFLPLRLALAVPTAGEQMLWAAYQSGEIIRIHVIANSDSVQDQSIKLKVRDALIEAFGELLREAGEDSSQSVYQLLQENAEQMQYAARRCAAQNGFFGEVQTEVGLLTLPEKHYGKVLLPEGEYRALRITLGEGKGQNWWCVLYPQLCLVLSQTDGESEADQLQWQTERILRNWLLLCK